MAKRETNRKPEGVARPAAPPAPPPKQQLLVAAVLFNEIEQGREITPEQMKDLKEFVEKPKRIPHIYPGAELRVVKSYEDRVLETAMAINGPWSDRGLAGGQLLQLRRHKWESMTARHEKAMALSQARAAMETATQYALEAILDLPTGRSEDEMNGQESAYRAVKALLP